mmetsp:Transcript_16710/g.46455  ORF Transcript_16710/g.46455 Transcript_16710/m.46455 type:complete len:795 (+) Transcript_16710:42-2426(+)
MGCCGGDEEDDAEELFEPRDRRCCTDIACLLLFVLAVAGSAWLTAESIRRDPNLLVDLIYPTDSYGNNCGRPGTATENLPAVIYPKFESDLLAQSATLATGAVWAFSPTKICAPSCPSSFSLSSPRVYGGADYPTSDGKGTPEFLYPWSTMGVASRCFPFDNSQALASAALCASPNCTDPALVAAFGDDVSCYTPGAEAVLSASGRNSTGVTVPNAAQTDTIVWQICSSGITAETCARQRAACNLEVVLTDSRSFRPAGSASSSSPLMMLYVYWIRTAYDAASGVSEGTGLSALLIFGVAIPFAMAYLWPIFLWLFARPVVIVLLILEVLLMVVAALFFMVKAGWFDAAADAVAVSFNSTNSTVDVLNEYNNLLDRAQSALDRVYNGSSSLLEASSSTSGQMVWSIVAVVQIILTILNIIMLIVYRKCIQRLIAILRECCKIFRSLVIIVFFPLGRMAAQCALLLYGVFGIYFVVWAWDDVAVGWHALMVIGHLFVTIWFITMARAVSWTTMAGAIAWWFVRQNAVKRTCSGQCPALGVTVMFSSLWTVLSRHLGSMAFGSFLIAVCWTLQLVLQALELSFSKQKKEGLWLLRLTLKCLVCFMECLKRTVQFISFYGFIYVAVEGDGFCRSCRSTFKLLATHTGQVAINSIVQRLLLLLVGLTTPIGCAIGALLYLEERSYYDYNHSPFYSALIIFLLAFLITSATCQVFAVSIDTVFVCAFKDMDENTPPKYLSDDMRMGLGLDSQPGRMGRHSSGKVVPEVNTALTESEPLTTDNALAFKPPPMPGQLSGKT